jgi:hypothetical protein
LAQKKWYLDVKRTPCAREALIHGIAGGMGMGLLYFLKSSESIGFSDADQMEGACSHLITSIFSNIH